MAPSEPLTVQPSWVHTASMAENALSLVRASRNTPATESTTTAPPTVASAEPLTATCTLLFVNFPVLVLSVVTLLPPPDDGDEGDEPHAAKSDRSVAEHAPVQNWRREM